jgi:beta-galactosidase
VLETTGNPAKLEAKSDKSIINANGKDLAFITVQISDEKGRIVPRSNNLIEFTVDGPGEIVATDNGDPTNLVPFPSHKREAFNGLALVIVRSYLDKTGTITINAKSSGLTDTLVRINAK